MIRWLVNFVICGVWVLIFNALGWITLSPRPHLLADPALGHLLDAALIGALVCVMGEVASFVWTVFVFATLGLGCLLLPLYWLLVGYVKLALTAALLPGWFTYSHNLIVVLIMSWILGAGRWGRRDEYRREHRESADPNEITTSYRVNDYE